MKKGEGERVGGKRAGDLAATQSKISNMY